MTAVCAVVLVAFIIWALLAPRRDPDDGTVVGFPADRRNRR
jgi:hypothetical protein